MLWVRHDGPLKGRQKSWDMALSDRGCRQMVTPAKQSIIRERQTEKLRHGSTRQRMVVKWQHLQNEALSETGRSAGPW